MFPYLGVLSRLVFGLFIRYKNDDRMTQLELHGIIMEKFKNIRIPKIIRKAECKIWYLCAIYLGARPFVRVKLTKVENGWNHYRPAGFHWFKKWKKEKIKQTLNKN